MENQERLREAQEIASLAARADRLLLEIKALIVSSSREPDWLDEWYEASCAAQDNKDD